MNLFTFLHNVRVGSGDALYLRYLHYIIDFWYVEDKDVINEFSFNLNNMCRHGNEC